MKLSDFLAGISAAATVEELEAAIQADFKHSYTGPTWTRICKARTEAGHRIAEQHEHGAFVPRFGPGRRLTVLGETYGVGRGGNSTGVRYAWHAAGQWAMSLMVEKGLPVRAAHSVWDLWSQYPHRCLRVIEDGLAGRIKDPVLGEMVRHERHGHGSPIRYTVEQNQADRHDRRATKPCECGGTLFDWGGGYSQGFDFINWHCNACPEVFTEYMSREAFYALRRNPKALAPMPANDTAPLESAA